MKPLAPLAPLAMPIAAALLATLPAAASAMANPASTFCIKVGGKSVLARLPDGSQIGLCQLPRNRIVEEWTLFRLLDGKPPRRGHILFR